MGEFARETISAPEDKAPLLLLAWSEWIIVIRVVAMHGGLGLGLGLIVPFIRGGISI